MTNIFKRLTDLADTLDKKGLYAEAGKVDEILKSALEEEELVDVYSKHKERLEHAGEEPEFEYEPGFGPEAEEWARKREEREKVRQWQKRYNKLYTKVKNLGYDMKAFPYLVEDGIWGQTTNKAHKVKYLLREAVMKGPKVAPDAGVAGKGPMKTPDKPQPTMSEFLEALSGLNKEYTTLSGKTPTSDQYEELKKRLQSKMKMYNISPRDAMVEEIKSWHGVVPSL